MTGRTHEAPAVNAVNAQRDVVVLGAGIAGCAAAYYLARRGCRVIVIERGVVGQEQSSRAWGFVRQQGRHPAEIPLAKAALRIWDGLDEELGQDVEFVRSGIMSLAETEADLRDLELGARHAADNGLTTRLITAKEVADLIPELQGQWRAGLFTPDDGQAEPGRATAAFADAARKLGVEFRTQTTALSIVKRRDAVAGVETTSGFVGAQTVLCCTGAGGTALVEPFGTVVPIKLIRASVGETNARPVFTRIAVWAPNVAYRPTRHGTFYVGGGYRGIGADYDMTLGSLRHIRHFLPSYAANWRRFRLNLNAEFLGDIKRRLGRAGAMPEARPNLDKITHNEAQLYALLPNVAGAGLKRVWAGRIDLTPDLIPAIGSIASVAGLFVAFGFSGHGFALGPIVGKLLSELVCDGRASLDISAFEPGRFRRGRSGAAREIR